MKFEMDWRSMLQQCAMSVGGNDKTAIFWSFKCKIKKLVLCPWNINRRAWLSNCVQQKKITAWDSYTDKQDGEDNGMFNDKEYFCPEE